LTSFRLLTSLWTWPTKRKCRWQRRSASACRGRLSGHNWTADCQKGNFPRPSNTPPQPCETSSWSTSDPSDAPLSSDG
jgi:hypothetical protein